MEKHTFDTTAYLRRLHLPDKVPATLEGLRTLQQAQFNHIPFENLDVQLGREIELDPEHLFNKLVLKRRGGYCFELNGLFQMALADAGFDYCPLLARVHLTGTPSGRGHLISLVDLEGEQWIVDAGFGKDTPQGPLKLELDLVQEFGDQSVRLIDGGKFGFMYQSLANGEWQNLYSFDMGYVCPADINYGNYYTSTNPNTIFTTARMAIKPYGEGLSILFNHRLTLTGSGEPKEIELPEGQGYLEALEKYFDIELDASYEDLKPLEK